MTLFSPRLRSHNNQEECSLYNLSISLATNKHRSRSYKDGLILEITMESLSSKIIVKGKRNKFSNTIQSVQLKKLEIVKLQNRS